MHLFDPHRDHGKISNCPPITRGWNLVRSTSSRIAGLPVERESEANYTFAEWRSYCGEAGWNLKRTRPLQHWTAYGATILSWIDTSTLVDPVFQVSSGFEESNGHPRLRTKRSQVPQTCEVITAVITSAV
jgi:hypothetical protein